MMGATSIDSLNADRTLKGLELLHNRVDEEYETMEEKGVEEHKPVLLLEAIEGLKINPEGIYVDATFGRGGHARAILAQLTAAGRLLVIDKDPDAILQARSLQAKDARVIVQQGSFKNLLQFCQAENWVGKVNGILMDLGVSSPQFNEAARGFSFRLEGPLDMRMDPSNGISAAAWINSAKESDIDEVLKKYGEERFHRRIARAIVAARAISPLTSTVQFAEVVAKAHPAWEKHKHPATRSFQAIRIFINDELNEISSALEQALAVLAPEGRLAVISFHSLEDRMVKRFIQKNERGDDYPTLLPVRAVDLNQRLRRVGRAIMPSEAEVNKNVRARSAVLRVAEKVGELA